MPIGFYDTVTQIKALELIQPMQNWLFDTFTYDKGVASEDEIVFDYMKHGIKAAPFVAPRVGGVVMEREGFVTNKFTFSNVAPKRVIDLDIVSQREFGEALMGTKTPSERAKRMMARDLKYMKNAIQVRRCAMAAELLNTGKITIDEFVEGGRIVPNAKEVDFGFDNKITLTAAWDTANGDPNADMEDAEDLVRKGLGVPAMHVMRSETYHALINNSKFQKQLDNRRMNLGTITPSYRNEPGLKFVGYNASGVEMYVYDGFYQGDKLDSSGNVIGTEIKYFIPDGRIICAAPRLFGVFHGPITQIDRDGSDMVTYRNREVPKIIKDAKNDTISQQVRSRPMLVPDNIDSWAIIDGAITTT